MQDGSSTASVFDDISLESVIIHYNVLVVHGINPTHHTGENSLLEPWVDWKTKLEILLAYEPTLSASSISEGDSLKRFWYGMGVLLSQGKIVRAHPEDDVTVAGSLTRKTVNGRFSDGKVLSQKISDAIFERNQYTDHYNEFVIASPKIAGFYICPDVLSKESFPALTMLQDVLEQYALPLYLIVEGKLYQGSLVKGQLLQGDMLPRDILIDKTYTLSADKKALLRHRFTEHTPFKLSMWNFYEYTLLQSFFAGKETYRDVSKALTASSSSSQHQQVLYGPTYRQGTFSSLDVFLSSLHQHLQRDGFFKEHFAYHLYGILQQARAFDDKATIEKVSTVANTMLSLQTMGAFISRRVSSAGTLKLVPEDYIALGINKTNFSHTV